MPDNIDALIDSFRKDVGQLFVEQAAKLNSEFRDGGATFGVGGLKRKTDYTAGPPSVVLSALLSDAPEDKPDGIQLVVAFPIQETDEGKRTMVNADVVWTDDPWEVPNGQFSDKPLPVSEETLGNILTELPRLIAILKGSIR